MSVDDTNSGAYRLFIKLKQSVMMEVGSLGKQHFQAGTYIYIGSAKRGLHQRVARHQRLAEEKQGRCHWHIDRLLSHPESRMVKTEHFDGADECRLSRELSVKEGVTIPVVGFGATDCKQGCRAHLYKIEEDI